MIDSLFSELAFALEKSYGLALGASFIWGVLSVLLSPCHLSGIPLIIGYISSQGVIKAKRTLLLALSFAFGTLVMIALIGAVTASMGMMLGDTGSWGNYIIALVFILMGLYLMGLVRLDWRGTPLAEEQRGGIWGAFLLGVLFGTGLGPCTFAFLAPVLGVVFTLGAKSWLEAVLLIAAFGIGHAAVIAAAGTMTHLVQRYLNWFSGSGSIKQVKRFFGLVLLGTDSIFSTRPSRRDKHTLFRCVGTLNRERATAHSPIGII
ncbi:cytochrome c biogenesis CcdA family protein [Chlorobium sp. KB01]|uniref:cytochrome c biogenesis CcdA family protein n=1 Tax=Chlorobium sp. KB01 TaxID=1917528 RepID=UPI0009FA8009|nr:cytochrome c biogenesis protein CcdA [Chlorobium sp. KB01]